MCHNITHLNFQIFFAFTLLFRTTSYEENISKRFSSDSTFSENLVELFPWYSMDISSNLRPGRKGVKEDILHM